MQPKFTINLRLTRLVAETSSLRERIAGSPVQVAWMPSLRREAAARNAMGSTAIEGFVLSLPEVRALASGKKIRRVLNMSERAVLNYIAALRYIQKNGSKKNLTGQDIRRLHTFIGEGAVEEGPVGRYRTVRNYVVDGTGSVVYTPPAPEEVPGLMDELLKWINEESGKYVPAISSGIIHYYIAAIHPFVDGNGRVARIAGTWELLRRKFDTLHIFSIDDIIYEHKRAYYTALENAGGREGDITGWLEFYLEVIAESLERAWKRILLLPKTAKTGKLTLTPKQEKLLTLLSETGDLSSAEIAQALKITVQGVHFIIKPLIEAHVVKRYGGRKTGKYGLSRRTKP